MNHDKYIGKTLGNLMSEDNGKNRYGIGFYNVDIAHNDRISLNIVIELCMRHSDRTYIDR